MIPEELHAQETGPHEEHTDASPTGEAGSMEEPAPPAPIEEPAPLVAPAHPYFGSFFNALRMAMGPGTSEYGLGLSLFALAVSTRSHRMIEIGRYTGFSTLALGSALRFLDECAWQEPEQHKQRPGLDYAAFEARREGVLFSIDLAASRQAQKRIARAGLERYVQLLDVRSDEAEIPGGPVDLLFIDGDHSYEGCKADVARYLPLLRPGGLLVLHDYFGWYEDGRNGSPVACVADEMIALKDWLHGSVLIDTGYMGFVVMRKPDPAVGT